MTAHCSRRRFFGVTGTAGLLASGLVTGCAAKDVHQNADRPVTIAHIFGETTIPEPPKRVVSAGYTGQDDLLAVGVTPVAVTDWFGGRPFAVWPWASSALGTAEPVVLNLDQGIGVEQIAGLAPDLIVATNAGVDADTYRQLSAIAPTVPQTAGDAFFEPWRVQADVIGRAVHRAAAMAARIDAVDRKFADVAAAHPGFAGMTVLLLPGRRDRGEIVATTGWRTEFLTRMGLTVADAPAAIGSERLRSARESADVLIWATDSDDERDALRSDPDIAAAESRCVFTTAELAGALAFASPLSYPLVADQLPPLIARITG